MSTTNFDTTPWLAPTTGTSENNNGPRTTLLARCRHCEGDRTRPVTESNEPKTHPNVPNIGRFERWAAGILSAQLINQAYLLP